MTDKTKLDWKDAPIEAGPGQGTPATPSPEEMQKIQQQSIQAAAQALAVLAQVTGMEPMEIERSIQEAQFRKNRQPTPVPMLDADTFEGHLYSARNIADKSMLWAAKLPMMTKLTIHRPEGEGQSGTVFGKEGDYLVKLQDREGLEIIPAQNFETFYRWIPNGYWPGCLAGHNILEDRAAELEKAPGSAALAEYAKLFKKVWNLGVSCRFQDGQLTIDAPVVDQTKAQIIAPPAEKDPPQYGYTLTRFGNGYMMLTDITGSQFPLLQGKVVDVLPKILELFRKTEGLETFGGFAWSSKGADNFVRKYMRSGHKMLSSAIKEEWQFSYYLLHKHTEYLAHPDRLPEQENEPAKPKAKILKPERRRKARVGKNLKDKVVLVGGGEKHE